MATATRIVAALASGTQETSLALAHINFDFSLIKVSHFMLLATREITDRTSSRPRPHSMGLDGSYQVNGKLQQKMD